MNFYYQGVLYSIDTTKPNIIILPGNKIVFYGGELESLPPQLIDGNLLLSIFKLITFQGGLSFAKLV